MTSKVGRNEFCPCGSGKKYKKCCMGSELSEMINSTKASNAVNEAEHQESTKRLLNRVEKVFGHLGKVITPSNFKMSEVIAHFADEMLSVATTKREEKTAIHLACLAWNMAVILEEDEALRSVKDSILDLFKSEEGADEIMYLINRKIEFYSGINTIIIDHEISYKSGSLYLNVIYKPYTPELAMQLIEKRFAMAS